MYKPNTFTNGVMGRAVPGYFCIVCSGNLKHLLNYFYKILLLNANNFIFGVIIGN